VGKQDALSGVKRQTTRADAAEITLEAANTGALECGCSGGGMERRHIADNAGSSAGSG